MTDNANEEEFDKSDVYSDNMKEKSDSLCVVLRSNITLYININEFEMCASILCFS